MQKKNFKSVPGPYMLEFTCHTKISAATEQITGPKYIYNLTPFEKLPEFINDTKNSMVSVYTKLSALLYKIHLYPNSILTDFLLSDILGIITEINEPEWIPFSNQPNPSLRRDIRLTDGW